MNRLLVFILALLVGLCPTGASAQASVDTTELAVLERGDAVRITVWRQPEMSGEFIVGASGTISHPLYREVVVAGQTIASARQRVREYLLRRETEPQFVLDALLSVSVIGEVRTPGLNRLPAGTTIAQAIAAAGGPNERAALAKARLVRGAESVTFDLSRPFTGIGQQAIRSGDQIFIDRKVDRYREYIVPAASVTAALAALVSVIVRLR